MTLTTEDTQWLRKADALCFDLLADNTSRLRVIRRQPSGQGVDLTWVIPALDTRVNNYGVGDGPWTGFHMEMNVAYDLKSQTIIRRLRAGTDFVLVWTRNNDNDVLREAGLVCDELHIRIGKADGKADTFMVAKQVGRDNTARMIRRA